MHNSFLHKLDLICYILLEIFASMFVRGIGLLFSFPVVSLSALGMKVMLASQYELGSVPSASIFRIDYRKLLSFISSLNV